MDTYQFIPNEKITRLGDISAKFLDLGIVDVSRAVHYVHDLPYGYNSNYDDPHILFKEGKGSCTSKHAVIANLAHELTISLHKNIGIYKMTEDLVTGTQEILDKYHIPYIPMIHCFLVYQQYRFDLTEGNINGKNHPIHDFIETKQVSPNFSQKDEYQWYKQILTDKIMHSQELQGISEKEILKARQEGITLLKNKVK